MYSHVTVAGTAERGPWATVHTAWGRRDHTLDRNRTRFARMARWSALVAVGALVVMACRAEDATPQPTEQPSTAPVAATIEPTPEPTLEPTPEPTLEPTPEPTPEPTLEPTPEPTEPPAATEVPVASAVPSASEMPIASEEPGVISGPAVTGAITLPEDAVLPEGASWTVYLQDTSVMDAPAVIIASASGDVEDITATEIPFAIPYDAGVIDERSTYTLTATIDDAEGNPLYISDTTDTTTDGIIAGEPLDEVPVQVQDVDIVADASEVPVVPQESPAA